MKTLRTDYLLDPVKQPLTKASLDLIMWNDEALMVSIASSISEYCKENQIPIVLHGLQNIGTLTAPNIKAGYIALGTYIYQCNGFTASSITNEIGFNTLNSYDANDPITFSDLSTHNVHQNISMVISDTATYHFKYSDLVFINQGWQSYTLQAGDVTANTGTVTLSSTASYKEISYYIDWKKMRIEINYNIDAMETSATTINEFYININSILPSFLSVANNCVNIGRFRNIGVGGDYTNVIAYHGLPTPYDRTIAISSENGNFNTTGTNNIKLQGQITINLV